MSAPHTLPLGHAFEGEHGDIILLLNGGMMTHGSWAPVTTGLIDRFRFLGCDFRGQLASPGEAHPRLARHVDDIVALLDSHQLAAVHVLGTSFGAEVGLLLAASHPQRVRTLAAVTAADCSPPGMGDDARAMQALIRQILAGDRDPGSFHDALVADVYSPDYRQQHAATLAARRRVNMPWTWFRGLLGILECIEDFDLRPVLGRVNCPTLVVHAALDTVMPTARVRALADAIEGAEWRVHPTSGHALVVEDPRWLADTYRDFLARHGALDSA